MKFKPVVRLDELGESNTLKLLDLFPKDMVVLDDEFLSFTPKLLKSQSILDLCPFHLYKYDIEKRIILNRDSPIVEYIGFVKSAHSYLFLTCLNEQSRHYIASNHKRYWDVCSYPMNRFALPALGFEKQTDYLDYIRGIIEQWVTKEAFLNNLEVIDLIAKDYESRCK